MEVVALAFWRNFIPRIQWLSSVRAWYAEYRSTLKTLVKLKLFSWSTYYGLFPLMLYVYGRTNTIVILGVVQFVVIFQLIYLYDRRRDDILGLQAFRWKIRAFLKKCESKPWWKRALLFTIVFILLCDQTDPFTVFVTMRGAGKKGVDGLGVLVIVATISLTTVYWSYVESFIGLLFVQFVIWMCGLIA